MWEASRTSAAPVSFLRSERTGLTVGPAPALSPELLSELVLALEGVGAGAKAPRIDEPREENQPAIVDHIRENTPPRGLLGAFVVGGSAVVVVVPDSVCELWLDAAAVGAEKADIEVVLEGLCVADGKVAVRTRLEGTKTRLTGAEGLARDSVVLTVMGTPEERSLVWAADGDGVGAAVVRRTRTDGGSVLVRPEDVRPALLTLPELLLKFEAVKFDDVKFEVVKFDAIKFKVVVLVVVVLDPAALDAVEFDGVVLVCEESDAVIFGNVRSDVAAFNTLELDAAPRCAVEFAVEFEPAVALWLNNVSPFSVRF